MTKFNRPQLKVCDREQSSMLFMLNLPSAEKVKAHFEDFETTLTLIDTDLCTASISMTLYADSVKTETENITMQLTGPSCLHVTQYRTIQFRSTEWERLSVNEYLLYGNLTMRNRTNLVVFEVIDHGASADANRNSKLNRLEFDGLIKRTDFRLVGNTWPSDHEDDIILKGILSFKSAASDSFQIARKPTVL